MCRPMLALPLNLASPNRCRRSSFEDLILVNGRMRWSRLENLFEEGSKSQDYDPAQVRRMPPCPASLPLVHPETAHALRWGGARSLAACQPATAGG